MFQDWGFLLAEIWVLLTLAAVVGLIAGAIVFGGQKPPNDFAELERLKIELTRMKTALRKMEEGGSMEKDNVVGNAGYVRPSVRPPAPSRPQKTAQTKPANSPVARPKPAQTPSSQSPNWAPPDTLPLVEPGPAFARSSQSVMEAATSPGIKPPGLQAPRDGLPDDLTKIKGVGVKLEQLCNALGVWHYDQIAAWSAAEVYWVDENLEGFKGRVSRDDWVAQSKALARNETPVFRRRPD